MLVVQIFCSQLRIICERCHKLGCKNRHPYEGLSERKEPCVGFVDNVSVKLKMFEKTE